jgi:hypothetical protein
MKNQIKIEQTNKQVNKQKCLHFFKKLIFLFSFESRVREPFYEKVLIVSSFRLNRLVADAELPICQRVSFAGGDRPVTDAALPIFQIPSGYRLQGEIGKKWGF